MQQYTANNNSPIENEITNSLILLKQDIKDYITNIDMRSNIETSLFNKIKGCYKNLITEFIDYTTDENNISNFQFMSNIKSELNSINRIIENYDNIIKGRIFEFRHRVSQLVAKLNTTNMSDSVSQLVRTVNLYDELTL
jgi:DNA polymerase III delta prime subunit